MNDQPLVSCVINFYNAEKFFQEAIESIFAQTYDHWELLLVDDGSTDSSTQIALEYAKKYPDKVFYLEHEGHANKGVSAAHNLGIRHCQGKYIAFLDADDVWLPEKLTKQIDILEARPEAGMIYGSLYYWYSWTGEPSDIAKDHIAEIWNFPANTMLSASEYIPLFLQEQILIPSNTCLVMRRSILEKTGGFEDFFRDGFYDDQVFVVKMSLAAPIIVTKDCLEKWRRHENSITFISENITGAGDQMRETYLNWVEKYLIKLNIQDEKIWRVLQRELLQYRSPLAYQFYQKLDGIKARLKKTAFTLANQLPDSTKLWLKTQWQNYRQKPPVGWVRWGSLRRLTPISPVWPNYRGKPIDRYYIEKFLANHHQNIQGHVLELGDATYTKQFGGDRITKSDILHGIPGNAGATIVADLTNAPHIADHTFDCIILTQTLLLIYDLRAAIQTVYRILKPGGVLLMTLPGITQIIRNDMEVYGQYWSFTEQSAQRLLAEVFTNSDITTETFGNVLTTTAFLYGLATCELSAKELDYHDPDYQLIIGVRVIKPKES
jgi:glycosyltransferase involved in cell wall biosynthesis